MGGGARADRCPGCASSAGPRARQSQEQQTMKLELKVVDFLIYQQAREKTSQPRE